MTKKQMWYVDIGIVIHATREYPNNETVLKILCVDASFSLTHSLRCVSIDMHIKLEKDIKSMLNEWRKPKKEFANKNIDKPTHFEEE